MPANAIAEPTRAVQGSSVPALVKQLRSTDSEVRVFPGQELRADVEKRQIVGFVPYNSRSRLLFDYFTEVIEPSAFKRAFAGEQDPRAYWGHSHLHVLGRYSSNTLRIEDSKKGLRYETDAPEGDWADSLLHNIHRGDVDESSFGFKLDHSNGDRWERDKETGAVTRYLVDVVLTDLSPVAEAAYPESKVSARAILLANEIDPDELAAALEVADADGISDPQLREVIYNASKTLQSLLGNVRAAEQPADNQDPPPDSVAGEPETEHLETAEGEPTAEAQARNAASELAPLWGRLRLLEMEGASNA